MPKCGLCEKSLDIGVRLLDYSDMTDRIVLLVCKTCFKEWLNR